MKAHKLNENGVIINTLAVESLDFEEGLIDASVGGIIGDSIINGAVVPRENSTDIINVPASVTRRQARQALLLRGFLNQVPVLLDAIEDEMQRELAKIEWEDSLDFERNRPLVIQIGLALGLGKEGLDELFIYASTL